MTQRVTGFDFYNPFFNAYITNGRGQRVILQERAFTSLAEEDTDLVLAGIESLPYVESITVNENFGVYSIDTVISAPYHISERILSSGLFDWGGDSRLSVQFGYLAGAQGEAVLGEVYEGLLLKPAIQLGTINKITLKAQGVGGWNAVRDEGKVFFRTPVSNERILQAILANIARKPNIGAAVLDLDLTREDQIASEKLALTRSWAQGARSDYAAMQEVARECQCYIRVFSRETRPDALPTAVFQLIPYGSRLARPRFKYSLYSKDLGGPFRPEQGTFPIISVSSPTTGAYLSSGAAAIKRTTVDSRTKEVVNKSAEQSAKTESEAEDGVTVVPYPGASIGGESVVSRNARSGKKVFSEKNDDLTDAQIQAIHDRERWRMGINLTVGSLGNPLLKPGMVVNVQGLGDKISGRSANYQVFTVSHRLGPSGYDTTFTAVSNSTALLESVNVSGTGATNSSLNENEFEVPDDTAAASDGGSVVTSSGEGFV